MARVLVVDDDDATRLTLRQALEHAGHEVSEARDGALALTLAQACDVVVMDIVMPVKGGLETLIELRGTRPRMGVVLMSGHVGDLPDALADKVARWVRKPFEMSELVAAVEAVVGV